MASSRSMPKRYDVRWVSARSAEAKWYLRVRAKIDTGAFRCSIHEPLAHALGWPVIGSVKVKNAMGRQERDLVRGEIRIGRSTYQAEFSLTDRSNLRTAMILGKDLLDRLNGEPPLPKDQGKQHPGYT